MANKKPQVEQVIGRFIRLEYRFDVAMVFPENPDAVSSRKKRNVMTEGEWRYAKADDLAAEISHLLGDGQTLSRPGLGNSRHGERAGLQRLGHSQGGAYG